MRNKYVKNNNFFNISKRQKIMLFEKKLLTIENTLELV